MLKGSGGHPGIRTLQSRTDATDLPRIPPDTEQDPTAKTIFGSGIALYASKRGLKVTLHERDEVIGGQVNRIYDPYKKKSFSALLRYYENAIRYYKIELVTNSNFSGNSIECLPPITYREPPDSGEVFESNVYANHDWFLRTAENKKIKVGKESLNSLDRGRKLGYISVAEGKGIEFIEGGDYDFSLMVDDQYDIQRAINLGIGKVKQFIIERENEFM